MRSFYEYIDNNLLFTMVFLPDSSEKYPVVVIRTPYHDYASEMTEIDVLNKCSLEVAKWVDNGYGVVLQHCRGTGKSHGDCVPYINEHKDTNSLYDWIRTTDFYNGELFLKGGSYLASVHYCAAPFASDIKGAIFDRQVTERYSICYRNGFLKKGFHGNWYVTKMYKKKSQKPNYDKNTSFEMLPLSDFTKKVFGEQVTDFDNMLKCPRPTDSHWSTHLGGTDARDSINNVNFPMLITTGLYDIYTGGIFDMWNNLSEETKNISAFVVSPYEHSDSPKLDLIYPDGKTSEKFGVNYDIEWFNYIRGKAPSPFTLGHITYYRLFENKWAVEKALETTKELNIKLGESKETYLYDPSNPPTFKGGLSCNFGGTAYQDSPFLRDDIITIYTEEFDKNIFVKGKSKALLNVKTDCEDTCFYVRLSITKPNGDLGLRDDITSILYQHDIYVPNTYINLEFNFDEHTFMIAKGEKLRIDIASACHEHYVRHTNLKGLFSIQTDYKVATNTIDLSNSNLIIPIE